MACGQRKRIHQRCDERDSKLGAILCCSATYSKGVRAIFSQNLLLQLVSAYFLRYGINGQSRSRRRLQRCWRAGYIDYQSAANKTITTFIARRSPGSVTRCSLASSAVRYNAVVQMFRYREYHMRYSTSAARKRSWPRIACSRQYSRPMQEVPCHANPRSQLPPGPD